MPATRDTNGKANGNAHGNDHTLPFPSEMRLPPQNLPAERSVLGSILRDNAVLDDVAQLLHTESFYTHAHQLLFRLFLELRNDRQSPIDLVTVGKCLIDRKQDHDIGGLDYLGELWDAAPSAANVLYYARIVREKAVARQLIHAATGILNDAYGSGMTANELLAKAEKSIFRIAEMGQEGSAVHISVAVQEALDRLDAIRRGCGGKGLDTGFTDLDKLTAGLHPELILLAARPSCGKTSMALSIIRNVAKAGTPVYFASLEQNRVEMANRLLCNEASVDSYGVRVGKLDNHCADRLIAAVDVIRGIGIHIDHTPNQTVTRIAAEARRKKLHNGVGLVVIDYLQLIEPENKRDSENMQLTIISRRLKNLQRELGIPVLVLAQLNREVEHRAQGRPKLADLRGSGSLEQDADTVLLIYQHPMQLGSDNQPLPQQEVELLVEKQRNGPTGSVKLIFDRRYTKFENHAEVPPVRPFRVIGDGNV